MTEIPEHLLKRSRERRAALGLEGGKSAETGEGAGEEAPAATPATTAEAAPAEAAPTGPAARAPAKEPEAPPPPTPDPPYVAAAKSRAKIPFWAMAALTALPIWAFMYVRAITAEPEVSAGPLGVGAEVFTARCASCHGGGGEGGSGRQLSDEEVWLTFPNIEDQIRFVYFGTSGYNAAEVSSYGDPDREGGEHTTGSFGVMPEWGELAGGPLHDDEILAAVCHSRFGIGGSPDLNADEAAAEEFELWCSDVAPAFQALQEGIPLADLDEAGLTVDGEEVEIIDIGEEPAEGSSAAE